jgi:hypothetical protein
MCLFKIFLDKNSQYGNLKTFNWEDWFGFLTNFIPSPAFFRINNLKKVSGAIMRYGASFCRSLSFKAET